MHNWPLGWFSSLYFMSLEPPACKATWDCWNYPAHMHEFFCADCKEESNEMGLLGPCGPNYHCSLCRGRTSSHSGLFINPKTGCLSAVVWGLPCDFFHPFLLSDILFFSVNAFSLSVLLLYFVITICILLSHVPHTWTLTQVSDSDYVCSRL
jgi:hypothetical protein